MGIKEDLGLNKVIDFFYSPNFVMWFGIIFLAIIIFVFIGLVTFFYYSKKEKKMSFKHQVPLFQNINGKPKRIGLDWAKELFVPDSNISLFFLKGYKIYLARPTRAMGQNEYWYTISENGEWVNFDLSNNEKDNTLAKINYDHRDTRYAFVNMKEIIKRNYKDKSLVWWKDPVVMNIISFVIMTLLFLGGCWFLIAKITLLVGEVAQLIEKIGPIVESINNAVTASQNINSGISSG